MWSAPQLLTTMGLLRVNEEVAAGLRCVQQPAAAREDVKEASICSQMQ